MTYQKSRRRNAEQRQSDIDTMKRIFRAVPLYQTETLDFLPEYGRSEYPDQLLFLCLVCSCVTGSQRSSLRTMDSPDVWPKLLKSYNERAKVELALPRPPSAKVLDLWVRNRVANDPAFMEVIRTGLRDVAWGLAHQLGYLRPHTPFDFLEATGRNAVAGDGSYLDPASTVSITRDADGEHVQGSRARSRDRVRVQNRTTEPNTEKPDARGINNVIISVPTESGALWVNVDQALGAETTTAMALLEEITDGMPRALHTLLYDKAVSGWMIEDFMARGVQVVGKSVVRSATAKNGEDDVDSHSRLRSIPADEARRRYWYDPIDAAPVPHDEQLTVDERLPLGTSVYPTAKQTENDDLDTRLLIQDVRAKQARAENRLEQAQALEAQAARVEPAGDARSADRMARDARKKEREQIYEGLVVEETRVYPVREEDLRDHVQPGCCSHSWWLDGDALVACELGPDRYWYKVGLAFCTSCKPEPDGRTGNYVWFMTWTVRCPNGTHTFRTVTRPTRTSAEDRQRWNRRGRKSGTEQAWASLRPLARAHGKRWAQIANGRNVAESTNAWLARCFTMLGPARARRLRASEQRLDLFCAWAYRIADVYWVAKNQKQVG